MTRGRVGAAVFAAVVGLSLGGCGMDKASEQARQRDTIGDVQIATTFCTSGDTDLESHSCAPYEHTHRGQALVAYRLPDGSEAPEGFSDDGGLRTFSRSSSYAAYMEATYPEEGMRWIAYVSDVQAPPVGFGSAFAVSPRFSPPRHPFAGPFPYKVVGGWRELTDPGDDGSTAVDCADTGSTSCAETGAAGQDDSLGTRDLAVMPGGEEPTVEAGGRVSVPFSLRLLGAGGDSVRFGLSASSDLDGASLSVDPSAVAGDVPVEVAVPGGTAPGTYSVTLAATAPGDDDVIIHRVRGAGRSASAMAKAGALERRTGTMNFRVIARPPPQPPDPDPAPSVEPPAPSGADPPAPDPAPQPAPAPQPGPAEPPVPAPRPASGRAKLHLSLAALPRRAYGGDFASYLVVASNAARQPALHTRVCERLPARVQFVQATRRVKFRGRDLCFDRGRLGAGRSMAALVYVHVDTDARPGMARARASATASNANRARARARLRVLRRAAPPRRAPVTG